MNFPKEHSEFKRTLKKLSNWVIKTNKLRFSNQKKYSKKYKSVKSNPKYLNNQ